MKKFNLKSNISLVFLCILILMQSCSVYKSGTLEEGVEKGKPVKVTYLGQPMKFEKVISKDGNYFGILRKDGELTEMVLNEEYSQKIKVKKFSTFLTIAIPVVATGAAIGIVALVAGSSGGWSAI